MFCGNCGSQIKEGAKFCPGCGQSVKNTSSRAEPVVVEPPKAALPPVCASCGMPLKKGALFCANCGQPVTVEMVQTEAVITEPMQEALIVTEPAQAEAVEPESVSVQAAQPVQQPENGENAEVSELYQIISEKNNENHRLASDIERITQERNQANGKFRQLQSTVGKMKGLIIALAIAVIASIGVGSYKYNEVDIARASLSWQNSNLKEIGLATVYGVAVDSISVGNSNNNSWVTQPDQPLNAVDVRYLNPVITYNSIINGDITFNIKIISPTGELKRNDSISPAGYSYSYTVKISSGSNQTVRLSGWGHSEESSYVRGNWRVEVWYKDIRLASTTVALN